jgi:hypothetical protein
MSLLQCCHSADLTRWLVYRHVAFWPCFGRCALIPAPLTFNPGVLDSYSVRCVCPCRLFWVCDSLIRSDFGVRVRAPLV